MAEPKKTPAAKRASAKKSPVAKSPVKKAPARKAPAKSAAPAKRTTAAQATTPTTEVTGPVMADIKLGKAVSKSASAVLVPVFADHLDDIDGVTAASLERDGFTGKADSTLRLPGGEQTRVLIGVGDSSKATADEFRRGAATVMRSLTRHEKLAVDLDGVLGTLESSDADLSAPEVVSAVSEGVLLGSYRFEVYRKAPEGQAEKQSVTVAVGERARLLTAPMTRARAVSNAVAFARDFVNEPGGTLTPTVFANRSATRAKEVGLKAEILDEKAIARERLGGLIAVNQGSVEPPRLLKLIYTPSGATAKTPTVCLVGKGITFDSGGLSLKPGESMYEMKNDMAGAAAVIATMCALPALAVGVKVVSFTPMTDNMTGGAAQRPGDIYTARNGKTVEVLNTDAEGRLVLGEALVLASEQKPEAIIDLATLTGACVVALGEKIAGLMSNSDDLVAKLEGAAKESGERVWHLPLPDDYRKGLDSKFADIKNIASRWGGTLTAGLFLREFVGDGIDWAHIDIAGPAFTSSADGENAPGGTGFGVRTLLRLLENW